MVNVKAVGYSTEEGWKDTVAAEQRKILAAIADKAKADDAATVKAVKAVKPTVTLKVAKGKKMKVTVTAKKAEGVKVACKVQHRVKGKGKYKTVTVKSNAKGKATKTIKKLKKGKKYQVRAYVAYSPDKSTTVKSKTSKVKVSGKVKK